MPFTAQEIGNSANALLEYNVRGPALSNVLQDRPLFRDLMGDLVEKRREFIFERGMKLKVDDIDYGS